MTANRTKTKLWLPIHERHYASGKRGWQVAFQVNRTRIRKTFETKGEAETFAAQEQTRIENEGRAAYSLSDETRTEAARAVEKLKPYDGETITNAVNFYIQHVLAYRNAPTVKTVLAEILSHKLASGRRERTIRQFRFMCERFALSFGDRRLSTITHNEIRAWLSNEQVHGKKLSAVSVINYMVAIGNLFTFGVKHGYCDANPVKLIDRPSREAGDVHFLTVDQVVALLIHSEKYDLVPYVALAVFAGLRPEKELRALDWQKINLTERTIRIDASLAKTRQRRVVEITDALASYLTPYAKRKGAVIPFDEQEFWRRWQQCRTDAGIVPWPHDVLRHSYATFHLAAFNDIGKLALQMGNSPQVIHSAYKGLVTKTDAERFFALRPAADAAGKIVPMKAAANA